MTTKTKMVGRRLHGSENGLKDGERKPKTDRNGRMSLGTLRSNCEDRNAIEDFIENSCCELTNCDIVGRPYVFLRKVLPPSSVRRMFGFRLHKAVTQTSKIGTDV